MEGCDDGCSVLSNATACEYNLEVHVNTYICLFFSFLSLLSPLLLQHLYDFESSPPSKLSLYTFLQLACNVKRALIGLVGA